jgi:hypothetical protein
MRRCASRCGMLAAGRRTGSGDLFRHDQPQHQRRPRHRQCASLSRTAVAWLALCCIGSCSASAGDRCDPSRTATRLQHLVEQLQAPPSPMHHTREGWKSTGSQIPNEMQGLACRDPAFRWCVSNCAGGDGCVMLPPAVSKHAAAECTAACPAQFDHPVPQALRLLRWSCEDDCRCAGCTVIQCTALMTLILVRCQHAAKMDDQLMIFSKRCSRTIFLSTSLQRSRKIC